MVIAKTIGLWKLIFKFVWAAEAYTKRSDSPAGPVNSL